VLLVHAFGWSQAEAAELVGVSVSTIRTHLARGLAKLQSTLEVETDVH
jgi:DNA-directed RNA polymerase specialized sigma24 family protein